MRTLLSRILELVFRSRREKRLSDEMQMHLDLLTDQYVEEGLSRDDARMKARRSFGGVEQIRMAHREQRGIPGIDSLLQDLRFGARVLSRERAFALTVVLVLGVGIGVNNIFFTIVYAHLFRGLPFPDADRVMSITAVDTRGAARPLSFPEFEALSRAQTSFTGIAVSTAGIVTIGDAGRAPDRYDATYATANAFPMLGVPPLLGRLPRTEEDRPGELPVVVLGETVWRLRYHADPNILGRSVLINGSPATVVGVLRDRSGFPTGAGIWLPLGQFPDISTSRTARPLRAFARLKDGVSETTARSEVEAFFTRFAADHPDTQAGLRGRVIQFNDALLGSGDGWESFIIAGIIVVLVACANVGNLMVARGLSRAPEIAVRASLGASRRRIVRQLMVEALILAAGGSAAGALISLAGVRVFSSVIPDGTLPYWYEYRMDGGVFTGLVVVSLVAVVVFGLIPALQASRTDVSRTLKDRGRGNTGTASIRLWTGAFLTVELALAMILLTNVAIASLSSRADLDTDRAIDTTAVVTASVTLPPQAYPTAARRNGFFRQVEERLNARAVVTASARTTMLPGDGGAAGLRRLAIERQPAGDPASQPEVQVIEISPRYFAAIGVAEPAGRGFTDHDAAGEPVAIVSERFVRVHFGGESALGQRISVSDRNAPLSTAPQWLTIVGVAPQIRQQGPRGANNEAPLVYLPVATASPATSILMVRHQGDPAAVSELLRSEVHEVDAAIPLYRMRTLAQAVRDAQWNTRLSALLATTVCLISLLLAVVGLYAVTAQRVTLKAQEIGLRMALGASRRRIAAMVLGALRVPLGCGLALGTIGAIAWDRAFAPATAVPSVSAAQTLVTIAALMLLVVAAACCLPIRRAAGTSPIVALREQ